MGGLAAAAKYARHAQLAVHRRRAVSAIRHPRLLDGAAGLALAAVLDTRRDHDSDVLDVPRDQDGAISTSVQLGLGRLHRVDLARNQHDDRVHGRSGLAVLRRVVTGDRGDRFALRLADGGRDSNARHHRRLVPAAQPVARARR